MASFMIQFYIFLPVLPRGGVSLKMYNVGANLTFSNNTKNILAFRQV